MEPISTGIGAGIAWALSKAGKLAVEKGGDLAKKAAGALAAKATEALKENEVVQSILKTLGTDKESEKRIALLEEEIDAAAKDNTELRASFEASLAELRTALEKENPAAAQTFRDIVVHQTVGDLSGNAQSTQTGVVFDNKG